MVAKYFRLLRTASSISMAYASGSQAGPRFAAGCDPHADFGCRPIRVQIDEYGALENVQRARAHILGIVQA